MSWLDKFKNSRFGRPFRNRQKLGEDEDVWYDALSNLHMDSSSSDEFVDAHEQVPVNSSPRHARGRKRKKTKSKSKKKKRNDREIFGDSSSSSSTADTFTGIEGTAEIHLANTQEEQQAQRKKKLQKRKSSKMQCHPPQPLADTYQGSKERSIRIGHRGYPFNPDNKQFKFKSSPEIPSSSSNVDGQMDTQHAQGGLTDAKLLEVAKAIGGNVGTICQLGGHLGFRCDQIKRYHPCGTSVDDSGTMRMLQEWKSKTSEEKQLPGLLAALRDSGLYSVANKLDIKKGDTNPPLAGKKGGKADSNKSKTSNAGTSKIANISVVKSFQELASSSLFGWWKPSSRKPIIYLCTSSEFHTISGFREWLQALIKRSYPGYEVKAQELPYNCLDEFRFKSEVNKTDAMILCHSVQNRGFSIIDVPNSIYDEYLRHCNQVFGKEHLAVIVHDIECTEEILRINMDTFRRTQPKTFQLAGFVALARKLDVADVQLPHDDLIKLQKFVKDL